MSALTARPMSRASRLGWFLVTAIVAVALDQASKVFATTYLKQTEHEPLSYLADTFRVQYALNEGAFLSLLSNTSKEVQFWILTVANGAVLIGLAMYLLSARVISRWNFIPLLLVVAGGIGNLIDRVRFQYVIDFLNVGIGDLRTGIFNVADMFISAGFIAMAIVLIRGEKEPVSSTQPGLGDALPPPQQVPHQGPV